MKKLRVALAIFVVCAGTITAMLWLGDGSAKADVAIVPSTTNPGGTGYCTKTFGSGTDTLPQTISDPGVYCLKQSFNYNDTNTVAITINVTSSPWGAVLDFGGYHLNATASSKTAISVTGNSHYVIRNGTITNFATGIRVTSTAGNVQIEKMRINGTTNDAIDFDGSGPITVRDCFIQQMTQGIAVSGTSAMVSIVDNIFLNQSGNSATAVIAFSDTFSGRAFIDNNQIMGTSRVPNGLKHV